MIFAVRRKAVNLRKPQWDYLRIFQNRTNRLQKGCLPNFTWTNTPYNDIKLFETRSHAQDVINQYKQINPRQYYYEVVRV